MKLTVNSDKQAMLEDPLSSAAVHCLSRLEGRKKWLKAGGLSLEPTPINLELLSAVGVEITGKVAAKDGQGSLLSDLAVQSPTPVSAVSARSSYLAKPSYKFQERALVKLRRFRVGAIFAETGTGKSKITIDRAGELIAAGEITGVLIAAPRGPHRQWVEEQIPKWFGTIDGERDTTSYLWPRDAKKNITPRYKWMAVNIDALRTARGYNAARDFLSAHAGRVLMAIDESQDIKNYASGRANACYELGALCAYRLIMSGTPIAKNIVDEWSQFKFLDERITGHRYVTSFKSEYCIIGGYSGYDIVGHKNLEKFFARVEPYVFRVTKEEELDLPPKVYSDYHFEMSDEQKRIYKELKSTFSAMLADGDTVAVRNAVSLIMRLQQVTSGIAPVLIGKDKKGKPIFEEHAIEPNARIAALRRLLETRTGKTIIWARFQSDIDSILAALGGEGIHYIGTDAQRAAAVAEFLSPTGRQYFVSNPASGGVGLNLQGDCRTAIYYSNSFDAIDRWQSEDRIHRIGTVGTVTYIDMICDKSVDNHIIQNLKQKKALSDLVLDDIRRIMEDDV